MTSEIHNPIDAMFVSREQLRVGPSQRFNSFRDGLFVGIEQPFGRVTLEANPHYVADRYDFRDRATRYVFSFADADADLVQSRQDLLSEIDGLGSDVEGKNLFDRATTFARNHLHWDSLDYDPIYSTKEFPVYTRRIEMFKRDAARNKAGEIIIDEPSITEMPSQARDGVVAIASFVDQKGDRYPLMSIIARKHREQLEQVAQKLEPLAYVHQEGRPKNITHALDASKDLVLKLDSTTSVVQKLTALECRPATITEQGFTRLEGIHHVKFARAQQELNDITIGKQPIALTGRNGSGKSFLLDAIGLGLVSSGSTGSAPATEATIIPIKSLSVLYRPQGGSNGLSAYGDEAKRWGEVLEWLESLPLDGKKLILSDEPFSTTDKDGQYELIKALTRRLQDLGAQIIMTSHTELGDLVSDGVIKAYNFISNDDRNRLLVEGVGDADSIEVARERGMDERIVARAQEILEGSPVLLKPLQREPIPLTIRPPVSERYGNLEPGLGWFLPRLPVLRSKSSNPHGWSDWEFNSPESHGYNETVYASDQVNFILGNNHMSPFGGVLDNIVFKGSTRNERDVVARRDLFQNLSNYEEVEALHSELIELANIFRLLTEEGARSSDIEQEGQYLSRYLYKPYIDPIMSVGMLLTDITNNYWAGYGHYASKQVPQKVRVDYMQAIIDTLLVVAEPKMPPEVAQLLTSYQDLVTSTQNIIDQTAETYKGAVEIEDGTEYPLDLRKQYWDVDPDYRERLFAFVNDAFDILMSAKTKEERENVDYYKRRMLYELDPIFFEMSPYSFEKRIPSSRIKPKTQINAHELNSVWATIQGTGHDDMPRYIVEGLGTILPRIAIDKLPEGAHDQFKRLLDVCTNSRASGMKTPGIGAIRVLEFLTSDQDRFDEISTRLKNVGGDIAQSMATYVESLGFNFDGFRRGSEYAKFISQQRKKAPKYEPSDKKNSARSTRDDRWSHYARHIKITPQRISIRSDDYFGRRELPVTLYSDLHKLAELVMLPTKSLQDYAPVAQGGSIDIPDMRYFGLSNEINPTIVYEGIGGVDVISGSNMSGKTTYMQGLFANIALKHAIGMLPSNGATIPTYAYNIYMDRPKQDAGKGLSSFTADIENWNKAIEVLDTAPPSIVFIDEPFSSAPARYQEVLLLSAIEWLSSRGHRVILATHNHEVVARIRNAEVRDIDVEFHNFHAELDADGAIDFTYKRQTGEAPSMAKAVAKKIGGASLARIFD